MIRMLYFCLQYLLKLRDDHDIYNEEEKLIRKCENCDGNQVQSNEKATTNTKSKNKNNTKQKTKKNNKLKNILRHNKNLLTATE